MAPSSMKQWTITGTEKGFDGLEYGDVQVPAVGENEVLVKINGASLNYRDLIIPKVSGFILRNKGETPSNLPNLLTQYEKGLYPFPTKFPVAACSDGAGEVVEVGSKVTRFQKGDKVRTWEKHPVRRETDHKPQGHHDCQLF